LEEPADDDCDEDEKRKKCERPEMLEFDERMDDEVWMHALSRMGDELRGVSAVGRENEKRRANDEANNEFAEEFALAVSRGFAA